MSRPVFPETPLASDAEWEAEQERNALRAVHWQRGWLRRFEYDKDGRIVRLLFRECGSTCPCHLPGWEGA